MGGDRLKPELRCSSPTRPTINGYAHAIQQRHDVVRVFVWFGSSSPCPHFTLIRATSTIWKPAVWRQGFRAGGARRRTRIPLRFSEAMRPTASFHVCSKAGSLALGSMLVK